MPRPRSGFDAQAPPLSYTPFSGSGSRPTNHRDQVARLCTSVAALTSDTAGPRERPRGQSSRAVASLSTLPPHSSGSPLLRPVRAPASGNPIPFAPRFPHLGLLTPARTGSHAPRRAQSPAIRADADGSPAPRPSPDGRYIARPLTDPSLRRRSDAPRGCCGRRVGAREDSSSAFGCRVCLTHSIPASRRACLCLCLCLSGSAGLLHQRVRPVTVPEALRLALCVRSSLLLGSSRRDARRRHTH